MLLFLNNSLNFTSRVEEDLRLNGEVSEDAHSNRRSSTSYRRSFFKRIKPQRGSSRDSKELASFSNTHLSLYLEASVNEDNFVGYQRVERLDCKELTFSLKLKLNMHLNFRFISSSTCYRSFK